jgi:hypothetical protein
LPGQGDVIKNLEENMIEAKPLVKSNTTDTAEKASFPKGFAALAMLTTRSSQETEIIIMQNLKHYLKLI